MYIIDKNAENEIIIKKSRFITKLYYIEDVNNVNDIINELKKEYKKCTHICYSYIIGPNTVGMSWSGSRRPLSQCSSAEQHKRQRDSALLSLHRAGAREKGAILSRERMAPFWSPKRTQGALPLDPDIGRLQLEELHALRNRGRCTWLRHEPLRFGSSSNRALLREARVTVDWRQTACGAASLRSPHYKKNDRVSGRFYRLSVRPRR